MAALRLEFKVEVAFCLYGFVMFISTPFLIKSRHLLGCLSQFSHVNAIPQGQETDKFVVCRQQGYPEGTCAALFGVVRLREDLFELLDVPDSEIFEHAT